LAFGNIVESEVLRAIEETTQDDPAKLQTAFDVYDGCSGKSEKVINLKLMILIMNFRVR